MFSLIEQNPKISTANKSPVEKLLLDISLRAKNYIDELYAMYIWDIWRSENDCGFDTVLSVNGYVNTKCGATAAVVLTSLLGWRAHSQLSLLHSFKTPQPELKSHEFDVYSISISDGQLVHKDGGITYCRGYIGHVFVAVRYKTESGYRFRIFQSYLDAYSLCDYLDKCSKNNFSNDYSSDEFFAFFNSLKNHFLTKEIWDDTTEQFHKKYFFTDSGNHGKRWNTTPSL